MNACLTNFQLKGCELNVIVSRSISLCIEFPMCKTADFLLIQVIFLAPQQNVCWDFGSSSFPSPWIIANEKVSSVL